MRTIHRDIVGAFIFSADGKLLLGKSVKGGVYKDCFLPPGGGIDEGETQHEALAREVLEETNIDISDADVELIPIDLSGQSEKVLKETGETVMVDMTFYNFKITLKTTHDQTDAKDGDDFEAIQWFDTTDLARIKLSPPTRETFIKIGMIPT